MKKTEVLKIINKLPEESVYCDEWVSAYSETLGGIELHLSRIEPREVVICT
jgi:hypothetical protein